MRKFFVGLFIGAFAIMGVNGAYTLSQPQMQTDLCVVSGIDHCNGVVYMVNPMGIEYTYNTDDTGDIYIGEYYTTTHDTHDIYDIKYTRVDLLQ